MTSIVVWQPRFDLCGDVRPIGYLELIGDSRVTRPTPGSKKLTITTDLAAKLLRLPVTIYENYEEGPGCYPAYSASMGFAFAGSVSAAVFTYSLCAQAFQSLRVDFGQAWPTMLDFGVYVSKVATRYSHDVLDSFEAFLVGSDPDTTAQAKTRCLHLEYDQLQRFYSASEIDLSADKSFAVIGSGKSIVKKKIEQGFDQNIGYNPASAILDEITSGAGTDVGPIGGFLQRARAEQGSFFALPLNGVNSEFDFGRAAGLYLNGEFGRIGSLRVRPPFEAF